MAELPALLARMHAASVALAYWSVPAGKAPPSESVQALGGRLVDRRRVYRADLERVSLPDDDSTVRITSYVASHPAPEVRALALASGEHSRFRVDSRLPTYVFESIYDAWITRSVRREIAEEVLVARVDSDIVGLVTIAARRDHGEIGLLSVAAAARGRGVGKSLVRSAQRWTLGRGLSEARVVTQGDNTAACALYESCGYAVEREDHVYHFVGPDFPTH